ncbi:MAG: hypothetical protein Hals2KO_05850 [Halioglobus sp.]
MKQIRVPTLQHLARNWNEDPLVISQNLLELIENPPPYSYSAMQSILLDLVFSRTDIDTAEKAMRRTEGRETFRDGCIQILKIASEYFTALEPDYVVSVQGRYYSISRDIQIPFHPLLMYGKNGKTIIPWFSFWASKPLKGESLSFFTSLVDEMVHSHPDYEDVELEILDFSAPNSKSPRDLKIVDSHSIPRIENSRLAERLEIFAS